MRQSVTRYRGALLGLAAGDALGTTVEFTRPGSFTPIDDIVGGGPFGLKPGQWTDDTSMALCLAESLVVAGIDPRRTLRKGPERAALKPADLKPAPLASGRGEGVAAATGRCKAAE